MEKSSSLKKLTEGKSFILVVVMVVSIIFFQVVNKNYLSGDNIRGILYMCTTTGIIAIGMACLLISGGIDLSAGATGMLGALIVAFLLKAGVNWLLSLVLGLAFGCVIGLVNAFFANVLGFMPFISTLAMTYVFQGIGNVITNAQSIAFANPTFSLLGMTMDKFIKAGDPESKIMEFLGVIPFPFVIMCILFAVYGFILTSTRFGRRMYMCGGNFNAARLAGIDPKKVTTVLYVNNSILAILAGSLVASRMGNASPTAVIGSELTGITAAVLGGVSFMGGGGGMGGAFIGLLLLNSFTNGLQVIGLQSYYQIVANGVLLIAALLLDFFREKARLRALKASMAGK